MTTDQAQTIINLLGTLVFLGTITTAMVTAGVAVWLRDHANR